MRHTTVTVSAFLLACLATQATSAQQQSPEMLAAGCMSCHGTNGRSLGNIPSIAGTDPGAFVAAMKAFRSGERKATVMNRIARGYTDPQLEAMAAYFSAQRGKR
jgi:cytochrome subunit of sulfide dehydrogenase